MNSPASPRRWQLGDWLIEPGRNSLRPLVTADTGERTLEPRVMAVLELLLRVSHENGSEPLSDERLLAEVWPGVAVSDASVYQAIAQLRKALGDSGKPYRYIGRVSGKGYLLLQTPQPFTEPNSAAAPVPAMMATGDSTVSEVITKAVLPHPAAAIVTTPPRSSRLLWLALVIGAAAISLGIWLLRSPPAVIANLPTDAGSVDTKPGAPVGTTVNTAVNPYLAIDPHGNTNDARPDSPGWDDYLQGRWLWNQRKPTQLLEAANYFSSALNKDPTLALAYVGLCDVFHFQHLYGDWPLQKVLAQCEPLLRDALQREPQLGAALASFGLLKLSQGDLDAAESYLKRAIEKNPKDAMALMWSGEVLHLRGKPEQALARMRQAEAMDPLSAIIKRNLYYTLVSSGDMIAAQQMLEEAWLLEPDYADRPVDEIEVRPLTVDRAVAFIKWARRFPDRTATNNPKRGLGVQTNLAVVYLALRDFEAADRALRQAEAADPNHAYVLLIRAIWWRGHGDKQKAYALLKKRAERYPGNAFFQQVAYLQQAELNHAEARAAFEQHYPEYRTAITPPLRVANARLLLFWLWLATPAERHALAPEVLALLKTQPLPARMTLNLRLLVGDETIKPLLHSLLQEGALMSPADDYLLPEDSPLWQSLGDEFLRALNRNRELAIQKLRR